MNLFLRKLLLEEGLKFTDLVVVHVSLITQFFYLIISKRMKGLIILVLHASKEGMSPVPIPRKLPN